MMTMATRDLKWEMRAANGSIPAIVWQLWPSAKTVEMYIYCPVIYELMYGK